MVATGDKPQRRAREIVALDEVIPLDDDDVTYLLGACLPSDGISRT